MRGRNQAFGPAFCLLCLSYTVRWTCADGSSQEKLGWQPTAKTPASSSAFLDLRIDSKTLNDPRFDSVKTRPDQHNKGVPTVSNFGSGPFSTLTKTGLNLPFKSPFPAPPVLQTHADALKLLTHAISAQKYFNKSDIPSPSDEQACIVRYISNGFNVIVDAVAGSGKTTSIVHIVASDPRRQILLLTYNKRLELETKKRVQSFRNIQVHTYHGFGHKYYSRSCSKDSGLRYVVTEDVPLLRIMPRFDLIILDEAQDLTDLLFEFLHKVVRDHQAKYAHGPPQFAILGDEKQAIFEYKGADARYLTMANKLLGNDRRWHTLPLTVSYRVTGNVAAFVNQVMLGHQHITAHKPAGDRVRYLVGCPFAAAKYVFLQICKLVREKIATPDDIFILAPSIKSQSRTPIKVLENLLCSSGFLVHLPLADESDVSEKVVKGKIVFSTFHQVKGLERPFVVVFGFDHKYFKYFHKTADERVCPPELYVAATRATVGLMLVAEALPGEHLAFLRRGVIDENNQKGFGFVEVINHANNSVWKKTDTAVSSPQNQQLIIVKEWLRHELLKRTKSPPLVQPVRIPSLPKLGATPNACKDSKPSAKGTLKQERKVFTSRDLTRYVPDLVVSSAKRPLSFKCLRMPEGEIRIKNVVLGLRGSNQSVADINCLAILGMLQVESGSQGDKPCSMYSQLLYASRDTETPMPQFLVDCVTKLKKPSQMRTDEPSDFLQLAALYLSGASISKGYISIVKQLTSYDWMKREEAWACMARLREAVNDSHEAQFQELTEYKYSLNGTVCFIQAQIDIVTPTTLWEVRCAPELNEEHYLQLAIKSWLWCKVRGEPFTSRVFRIMNVLTNEIWEMAPDGLEQTMEVLLHHHLNRSQQARSDTEFLSRACNLALPLAKRRRF